MQCACAVLYYPLWPAPLYIVSTLSHKRHDFRDVSEQKKNMFRFSLQLFFQSLLTVRKVQQDIITNVPAVRVKQPLFLSGFNETWLFSTGFRKNTQI